MSTKPSVIESSSEPARLIGVITTAVVTLLSALVMLGALTLTKEQVNGAAIAVGAALTIIGAGSSLVQGWWTRKHVQPLNVAVDDPHPPIPPPSSDDEPPTPLLPGEG